MRLFRTLFFLIFAFLVGGTTLLAVWDMSPSTHLVEKAVVRDRPER